MMIFYLKHIFKHLIINFHALCRHALQSKKFSPKKMCFLQLYHVLFHSHLTYCISIGLQLISYICVYKIEL